MTTPSFLRRLFRGAARKSASFRKVLTIFGGAPAWSTSDLEAFAREGYSGNPYVRAALDTIARAMAGAPPVLYRVRQGSKFERQFRAAYGIDAALAGFSERPHSLRAALRATISTRSAVLVAGGVHPSRARRMVTKSLVRTGDLEEVTAHPILDLLTRPNGYYQTTYAELVRAHALSMNLAGVAYYEPRGVQGVSTAPKELYILPAHTIARQRPEVNNPLPGFYYRTNPDVGWKYSPDPALTEMFYLREYDPINPLNGLSPLEAAIRSVDLNNEARSFNLENLRAGGVPSMLITGEFGEDEAEAIRQGYADSNGGSSNAGRVLAIGGKGIEVKQLSVDAAKLMWADILSMTAREIAIVFGVAPEILGDSANKTYSNYAEARLALYQERVLPDLDTMYGGWNATWVTRFGPDLWLDYDTDAMLALVEDTKRRNEMLKLATWMTVNEQRVAAGMDAMAGGDDLLVPAGMIPLGLVGEETMPVRSDSREGFAVTDLLARLPALSGDGA